MVISISSTNEESKFTHSSPYPILEEVISHEAQKAYQEPEPMLESAPQIFLVADSAPIQNPLASS